MTVSAQKAPDPVREFLGEFALAVHRYLIYPPDHPLLAENAEKVLKVLGPARPRSGPLDITVAGNCLLVAGEGESEGPKHGELAHKLREMGIGGIGIEPGAALSDVQALLEFLSARAKSGETSLKPGTEIPGTAAVEVRPISLSGLEISWDEEEEEEADRLSQLWLALDNAIGQLADGELQPSGGGFRAAGAAELGDGEEHDKEAIARLASGLTQSSRTASGSALAVGYLRQLASAVGKSPTGTQASMIRRRLGGLISALDPETIRQLAAAAGEGKDRAAFVSDLGVLGDEAVAKVLKSLANQSAKSLTESLARLFGKMSRQSVAGPGRVAQETQRAMRRSLLALLKEWSLEDPNPTEYGASLERISMTLAGADSDWDLSGGREPERVLQMSIELRSFGPVAERAAEYLLFQAEEGLKRLVDLIDGQEEENPAVQALTRIIYEPERILVLADAEDVEDSTLRKLVDRIGERAIPPLIEVLEKAESRTVRRKVFDRLVDFGAVAAEAALRRLPDDRWYVSRNLLSLARKAGFHFAWFDPDPYLGHEKASVRREAFLLAYLDPKRRTSALAAALKEDDDRLIFGALAELEAGVPSIIATTLAEWITDGKTPEARRISAIKAISASRAPVVVDALVEAATYKTRFLRRLKLAKEPAVVTAALAVLAESWARNPKARTALQLAGRSGVPEYREAARTDR